MLVTDYEQNIEKWYESVLIKKILENDILKVKKITKPGEDNLSFFLFLTNALMQNKIY